MPSHCPKKDLASNPDHSWVLSQASITSLHALSLALSIWTIASIVVTTTWGSRKKCRKYNFRLPWSPKHGKQKNLQSGREQLQRLREGLDVTKEEKGQVFESASVCKARDLFRIANVLVHGINAALCNTSINFQSAKKLEMFGKLLNQARCSWNILSAFRLLFLLCLPACWAKIHGEIRTPANKQTAPPGQSRAKWAPPQL